ncbi:MAG TPA: DUF4845 domain-containing protein [Steroidobacteraceae bacterium]|jgi:hypothetical protein|nr:DUF4845 domain-containing protein [Steroidobacteraceae bacterium]
MRKKQQGVTFLGWVFLLIPVAIVVYAGIRLAPVYLNYMRVARTVTQVAEEARGDDTTNAGTLRVALGKRLDIESVEFPDLKDFVIRRDGTQWVIEVKYEEPIPFIYNVSLLATFDKSARVGKGSAEP